MMNKQVLMGSIAYCGLVCGLCHLKNSCDGCKSTAQLCQRSGVCFQRACCLGKGLEGCWGCDDFPCGKDMHSTAHDLRIRAFVKFIQEEGKEALAECLLHNEVNGIHYGYNLDYDGKSSEEEVIQLLKGKG